MSVRQGHPAADSRPFVGQGVDRRAADPADGEVALPVPDLGTALDRDAALTEQPSRSEGPWRTRRGAARALAERPAGRPLDRCPVQVALPPWCSAQWIVAWDRSQSAARDEPPAAARRPTPRSTRPRARPARSAAARAGDSTAAFVAAAPRPGARAGDESPSKLPRSCGRRLRRSSRLTVDRARASRRAISRTASRRPCGAVRGTPSVAGLCGRCRASVPAATVPIPDFSALRSDPGMLRIPLVTSADRQSDPPIRLPTGRLRRAPSRTSAQPRPRRSPAP